MRRPYSGKKNTLDDEAVIVRYKETGNTALLGRLFERYVPLVFGLCLKYFKNKERAEDQTMQIFEKLLTDLRSHEINCFRAWLYTYSKNACLMELRKTSHYTVEYNQPIQNIPMGEENNNEPLKETLLSNLDKFMDFLNPQQKECIKLFYLNRLSYKDVSCKTGLSIREVKSHIQNGKRNLKMTMNLFIQQFHNENN